MKSIPPGILKLDLSNNPRIGFTSYKIISEHFTTVLSNVETLILENNDCGDEACEVICNALHDHKITFLNLRYFNLNHF
jgi:hypothetical protein